MTYENNLYYKIYNIIKIIIIISCEKYFLFFNIFIISKYIKYYVALHRCNSQLPTDQAILSPLVLLEEFDF